MKRSDDTFKIEFGLFERNLPEREAPVTFMSHVRHKYGSSGTACGVLLKIHISLLVHCNTNLNKDMLMYILLGCPGCYLT
jgi:hypothetical protein